MGLFDKIFSLNQAQENSSLNQVNIEQANEISQKNAKLHDQETLLSIQRQRIHELEIKANRPQAPSIDEFDLEIEVEELKRELAELKSDSKKDSSNNVKNKIKLSSELANWIISQRSFKEQAMQYALQLGKTCEEVLNENKNFIDIISNNKSELGNNVNEDILIDSKEFNLSEEKRFESIRKSDEVRNQILMRQNKPIQVRDMDMTIKDFTDDINSYESFLSNKRNFNKKMEERDKVLREKFGIKDKE